MPAIRAYSRAAERVTRLCENGADTRSIRVAVLDEIRRVTAFDAYAWLLTDPETEVGSAPLADVPCLPELPRLIRLKYSTTINRWTHLDHAVALLSAATGGHLEQSLVWRELLKRYGVNDVASVVFRDRFGCWGFLDLWLTEPGGPFTTTDVDFLSSIAPTVTGALRRAQAHVFSTGGVPLPRTGPIVLVLSPDLEVKAQTPETQQYLQILIPPEDHRPPVPAGAYNVAAQLLAFEAGIDDHPPVTRVHLRSSTWLTLRAARIGVEHGTTDERDIAVTIELTAPAERLSLFARACGMTPREQELLRLLATGADTRGIAKQMFVSEHTVQDHLKSIFAKSGTRNRRALLSIATGE